MYIESNNRIMRIFTVSSRYETYGKLDELLNLLPKKLFVHPHKSYLINLYFVDSLTAKIVILKSGVTLPVSRTFNQSLKSAFLAYLNN